LKKTVVSLLILVIAVFPYMGQISTAQAESASTWNIDTVDSTGSVGGYNSIALDSLDNPHISYYSWTNEDLKYAKWTGSTWSIETVDSAGDVGRFSSLALDSADNPHIGYHDNTNDDLKYARWDGSAWNIETVDSTGDTGDDNSLALDSSDNPHISYFEYTNADLKYAMWNGSTWRIETVDSANTTGAGTSLALDSADNPHISYLYVTQDDLRYAYATSTPVHNLDTGLNYPTIQATIDAPETLNGHTIQVDAGTYYENVVVTKSISLIGENNSNTIVDGGGGGIVLNITANNVTVSNFTIKNSGPEIGPSGFYGLVLYRCNNTLIQNNKITQNYMGLVVSRSVNNLFRNNALVDNVYNFVVDGQDMLEHFLQDIDTSNTVNGEPIYYWINHENEQVPSDAGFVALVNCTNVLVENLNLKNNFFGLLITYSRNTTVKNNNITDNYGGVAIWYGSYDNQIIENIIEQNHIGVFGYGWTYRPSNNWFIGNTITTNELGMYLWRTYNNTICGNSITANDRGIYFWATYNSSVYENNISDNENGIGLSDSVRDNKFYHNNLVNNTVQASASSLNTEDNAWDNGYPSGGNYWSDYNGTDNDGDGIGETPYIIDENNQDNYPLTGPFGITEHVFNVTIEDTPIPVTINSNSSISEFDFSETSLQVSFNVTGPTGTTGFCNITIPEDLLWGDFSVYLNGEPLVEGLDYTRTYNGTHNIFYITYSHSSHLIEITGTHVIPEYSSLIILSLLLTATLLIIVNKKRLFHQRS